MLILGIETSCDETSIAVVSDKKKILSNIVYSQIKQHQKYGGVIPEIAARAHLDKIEEVFKSALDEANITIKEISAIAATCGPGLIGGVIIGTSFGKGLACSLDIPFIPINHIMAHAITPRLTSELSYPYLLLLASGGHTFIAEIFSAKKTNIIGRTIDDSAGECFDKVAKMLSIPYPGGPTIEEYAKKGDKNRFQFPIPLKNKHNSDFSFSGLKTAISNTIKDLGCYLDEQTIYDICASFQETVSEIFINKLNESIKIMDPSIKSIAFSGGVSANQFITKKIKDFAIEKQLEVFSPPINLCTDNGAMIAWCGIEQFSNNYELDFDPKPRWPI